MKCKKPKKNTGMLVLLGILAAVLLILIIVIFRLNRNSATQEQEEIMQSSEEESTQAAVETTTAETTQEETESETREEAKQDGYIIIGDSHVVVTDGLGYGVYGSAVEGVVYNENLFFVHTGLDPVMGTFEWLKGDGTAQIQTIIEEHPQIGDWNIISIHGTSMVTMPDIAARYIDNYEKWINDTFSRYHVYMVSIPPLDEKAWKEKHPDVPRDNESIKAFNKQIKEAFPENYFDYYDWFLEHDDFQDEIHYTGKTYCMLFDEIINKIKTQS